MNGQSKLKRQNREEKEKLTGTQGGGRKCSSLAGVDGRYHIQRWEENPNYDSGVNCHEQWLRIIKRIPPPHCSFLWLLLFGLELLYDYHSRVNRHRLLSSSLLGRKKENPNCKVNQSESEGVIFHLFNSLHTQITTASYGQLSGSMFLFRYLTLVHFCT